MRKREKVQLTIKPKYGFGDKGNEKHGIPEDAVITYEVYLISFENPKEPYEMDIEEKLETSKLVKEKGTKFFKVCLQGHFILPYFRAYFLIQKSVGWTFDTLELPPA